MTEVNARVSFNGFKYSKKQTLSTSLIRYMSWINFSDTSWKTGTSESYPQVKILEFGRSDGRKLWSQLIPFRAVHDFSRCPFSPCTATMLSNHVSWSVSFLDMLIILSYSTWASDPSNNSLIPVSWLLGIFSPYKVSHRVHFIGIHLDYCGSLDWILVRDMSCVWRSGNICGQGASFRFGQVYYSELNKPKQILSQSEFFMNLLSSVDSKTFLDWIAEISFFFPLITCGASTKNFAVFRAR